MIYPKDFEKKLDFDAIRRILEADCVSEMGREEVRQMSFSSNLKTVRVLLHQTDEMRELLSRGLALPGDTIFDIIPDLNSLKVAGSYLPGEALLRLLKMIDSMREVRSFFLSRSEEDDNPLYPNLGKVVEPIENFPSIASEISRCINRFGQVKDNASPELFEIRRQISAAQGAMSRAMRSVISRAVGAGIIDSDVTPAVRDGRLCIPVAAGGKKKIAGIVHDESATGKTVFIEPVEVVEASNRLRELEMEERREVIAVLVGVANVIRPEIDDVAKSCLILGKIDFIRAKAKFAISIDASMPVLEKGVEIDWFHAVHPVLMLNLRRQGREVVPLDLHLDSKNRILVISGPNAGGKSVCLKTVGTVQYMLQCGLLPSLYSNSHVSVFDSIFVDIGDEQSMENDLSTYSSHLKNMKYFLSHSDSHTLFLADEIGSGTEPQIGGALAQSILEKLGKMGAFGVVTTHYQNIKTFAEEAEGFVNGAMLYDRKNLRPLFRLSVGNPGSSFALEIARNIGLPSDVIDSAKQLVGKDYVDMDKYLLDITRDKRYWENKRRNIKEKEAKLDSLLEKYEGSASDLKSRRAEIIADARREAREIMKTANARLEKAIRDIRNAEAEKERTRQVRRELEEYKASLESDSEDPEKLPEVLRPLRHKSNASRKKVVEPRKPVSQDIKAGDYVKMTDGNSVGQVLSIEGKRAEVAFGALRTLVELSKLKPAQKPKEKASQQTLSVSKATAEESRRRQLNFKNEIDVRGMRADEAIQAVTYFLDDAIQFNASRLRILHGTGHGILKTLIREQLRANPNVSHFADEDVRFGGAGITVVDLD